MNPGRLLECVANVELVGEAEQFVLDRESQMIVELSTLLRSFREIPDDAVIGTVKITIEMADQAEWRSPYGPTPLLP